MEKLQQDQSLLLTEPLPHETPEGVSESSIARALRALREHVRTLVLLATLMVPNGGEAGPPKIFRAPQVSSGYIGGQGGGYSAPSYGYGFGYVPNPYFGLNVPPSFAYSPYLPRHLDVSYFYGAYSNPPSLAPYLGSSFTGYQPYGPGYPYGYLPYPR